VRGNEEEGTGTLTWSRGGRPFLRLHPTATDVTFVVEVPDRLAPLLLALPQLDEELRSALRGPVRGRARRQIRLPLDSAQRALGVTEILRALARAG
jgi:hypothetical protein